MGAIQGENYRHDCRKEVKSIWIFSNLPFPMYKNTVLKTAIYWCQMTQEVIEQQYRTDGRERNRSPKAGLSAYNHKLPLLAREPKFPICHPPPESHTANSVDFFADAFLSDQVLGIQLCIIDVQRQNTDCRPRAFSETINKKGRNARSGHRTLWPVKQSCLLQVLTFGWTVRRSVILWETTIQTKSAYSPGAQGAWISELALTYLVSTEEVQEVSDPL